MILKNWKKKIDIEATFTGHLNSYKGMTEFLGPFAIYIDKIL